MPHRKPTDNGARRIRKLAASTASLLLLAVAAGSAAGQPEVRVDRAAEVEERFAYWLPPPDIAPVEPTRVSRNACLLEDLDYMRAPLFRVLGATGSSVRLRPSVPGVPPSRYSSRERRRVAARTIVLASRTVAGYRCVYALSPQGLRSGFVPATLLERIDDPPPGPAEHVIGDWFEGGGGPWITPDVPANHIRITANSTGELHLLGEASWGAGSDHPDVHTGGFDAPIHEQAGMWRGEHNCRIRFRMRGPFLMMADDGECGGANVSFVGIYVRAETPIPFVLRAL